jgi:hypothetical protein
MEPETVMNLMGSAFQEKVVQFGLAFTFAAWIHSSRVKKEINALGNGIIESVNGVAMALRLDLETQAKRMTEIENGFGQLSSRVDALEKKGEK